ncbi:hypothetical protein FH972_002098 [Carpinus fangiana]|uniref:Pentacotripeptide-repeat region of PRORP domain-containing protein n=1 Tax=Carpinus fangiana TaxID=176857 RepID=A0A5N6QDS9_9ROSI|nr:hypothetical protein FH972_002098 [Carpinus fangiana]
MSLSSDPVLPERRSTPGINFMPTFATWVSAWNGPYEAAISLFNQMLDYGLAPDNFTFPFVLKACLALSAIEEGRKIHEHAMRTGWETDVFVGAGLVDIDVVLWNSMLAAYLQNGHPNESLTLCSEMASASVKPTEATLVTAISASADIAALHQ